MLPLEPTVEPIGIVLLVCLRMMYKKQCCISRLGESISEDLECNFSVTLAENIGISWKMSQDGSNWEYLGIFQIYRAGV
jgi:hypothetical protein